MDGDRWYHKPNPCDIGRARVLAPVGDLMAWLQEHLIDSTSCPCCRFGRVVGIALGAFVLGLAM